MNILSYQAEQEIVRILSTLAAKATGTGESNVSLASKEFWTTSELIDRGWSKSEIKTFVSKGELTKIPGAGRSGDKYPSIQLIKIQEKYYEKS